MKSFTKFFLLYVLAGTAMAGCQDEVELDLPEGEEFLVVEGWLTNEEHPHVVKLSFTQAYFDNTTPPPATGATVIVRAQSGEETVLEESPAGSYTFPSGGQIGESYQLEISLPDGRHFLSSYEEIQQPVAIDSIYWELPEEGEFFEEDDDFPERIYAVYIDTQEPPGLGDNYRWRVIRNGVEANDPFDLFIIDDLFVDGSAVPRLTVATELFGLGDTVTIVQERINRPAYDFLLQLRSVTVVGGPYDAPPAPVEGNVVNTSDDRRPAVGYFGAAGRSRATVVVGE